MTKSAGDVCARATATATDGAWVPTPELVPPTPAKESTVQRDSWTRFSAWPSRLDWFAHGAIGLIVAAIVRAGEVRHAATAAARSSAYGRGVSWWLGLALVVAGVLLLEHELVSTVWPALMRGDSLWAAVSAGGFVGGGR
ncbi:MAG TPA: hypothetical protein VOB72_23065 [Candidatus Dormibacteraeota bacterium]|nr:hypothetical protein [Candidatus Dormibacteraeota bacterium]